MSRFPFASPRARAILLIFLTALPAFGFIFFAPTEAGQLIVRVGLPGGSTLTVYDRNGVVSVRYPGVATWGATIAWERPGVKTVLADHRGGAAEAVDLDDSQQLFTPAPLQARYQGGDVSIAVEIPLAAALADADEMLVRNLAGLGFVVALGLVAAWIGGELFPLRRLRTLVNDSNRPRPGGVNLHPRLPGRAWKARGRPATVRELAASLEQRTIQLHQAEVRYRTLVEQIPAVIYVAACDEHDNTLYVSPQIETLLGFSPSEWIAKPGLWLERLHPDDRERVLAEVTRSQATRTPFAAEYRLLARDERVVWVRDEAMLVRDDSSGLVFQQGVWLDITARKRAEEERTKLLSVVTQTADSVMIAARNGLIEYVNPGFETLTGYRKDEVVGQTPALLSSGSHDAQFYDELWQTILEGRVFRAVFINRKKNGELYDQEETITPVRDASGAITHFVSTGRDITERRRAEEAVRESEARFRAMFEGAAIGVTLVDTDGRVIESNRALCEMLGYSAEELAQRAMAEFTHPDDVAADRELYEELIAGKRDHYQLEKRYIRKDGTVVWGRLTVSLVQGAGGEPRFAIGMAEDITAHKRAAQAEREQRDLAEALRDTAEALTSTLHLDEVLDRILANVGRVVPHDAANIMLSGEGGGRVVGYRGCLEHSAERPVLGRHLVIAETPTLRQMTETRQPLIIPDLGAFPGWIDLARPRWQHSYLGVPICVKDEVIGFLNLDSAVPDFFTAAHAQRLQAFAHQAAVALENARLFAETERRLQRIQALHAIDVAIGASLDFNTTVSILLEQATTRLGIDGASVMLLNPYTQTLEYAAGRGFRSDAIKHSRVRLGEGYAGRAALECRTLSISSLASAHDFTRADLLAGEDFVAYYAVPLVAKGQVEGVLELFHRSLLSPDPEWLAFLETVAGQAAIALDNVALFDRLQRSNLELAQAYDTTLEGWSRALELRDEATEGHTCRVTEMTVRLAGAMGMSEAELVHVRRGALLHDIGKMGIPDRILLKSGPLTEEEWDIMRRHPVYAYEMLSPIDFLRPALAIPYCHHERWDGSGYPHGLKEAEIPLPARIFAVADVWDALRSDRPYNKGWPDEQVREHIRSLAGVHFDPKVVELFLHMVG